MNDKYPTGQRSCATCLYLDFHPETGRENCLRFARFVDHALTEKTRDCDYFEPLAAEATQGREG
ncbi:MAG TPA: hypothetical protein PK836_01245 [Syntrophales bacterium]|nr:hypothetical protein [Syntrophales bacterium]HOM06369.1 hypothetical protein [Syntrophales bacterium]HON99180.1 hypothetical protein [Syntrophales bacterium]HPC00288.1 hypothetical protein [Syntrophales bacterium]HPQ05951.1 hypothetical protein [Syntrophales bacterium]